MSVNLKISVITVVYNAGKFFEWTLKSIQEQKYDHIEYIVVDGGSKDNTLDLIEKYDHVISKWISEPDEGLYSAMNKGLHMASGDYVLFLNAGDIFFNDDVLMHIFSFPDPGSDILYGQTMIIDQQGNNIGIRRLKAPDQLTFKSLINGMLVCHQSFIVKRSICMDYNLKYKIAADYDWMLNCLKQARTITNSQLIISKFLDGGLNKQNMIKALYERFLIMTRNYNFFVVVLNHFRIGYRFVISLYRYGRF